MSLLVLERSAPAPIGHNRPRLDVLTKPELVEDHAELVRECDALKVRAKALPIVDATLAEKPDAELGQMIADYSAFQISVNATLAEVEQHRADTKAPYKAVTDAVDGFFNKELRDGLNPLKATAAALGGRIGAEKGRRERAAAEAHAAALRQAEQERLAAAAALEDAGRHTEADTHLRATEAIGDMATKAEAAVVETRFGKTQTSFGTASTRTVERRAIDRATLDLESLRPFLGVDALDAAVRAWRAVNKGVALRGVTFTDEPILSTRAR